MKVLIISQYFWPENFKINDIALGLKEKGHEVVVLTGIPNYPQGAFFDGYNKNSGDEEWEGIKIYRSKLLPRGGGGGVKLFLNYFSFAFNASIKVSKINDSFDKILVFETSPVTVGIPAIFAKKRFKSPYYFWVQDLWPASLTAAGGVNNRLVLGFFDHLTRLIYKHSSKVLIQSRAFKDYILKQKVAVEKIVYLPNTTESFYKLIPKSSKYDSIIPDGFKIIFAGNLGEAQSLDTFVHATKVVIDKGYNIQWVIVGDGRYKATLQELISKLGVEKHIHFVGKYPSTEMSDFFSYANALYVTLKDEYIFSLTIPSKIQSYLACGKPILASLNGEGAKIIKESNSGYVSNAEDVSGLVDNIIKIYKLSEDERKQLGNNGLNYFNKEFKRSVVLDTLEKILKS